MNINEASRTPTGTTILNAQAVPDTDMEQVFDGFEQKVHAIYQKAWKNWGVSCGDLHEPLARADVSALPSAESVPSIQYDHNLDPETQLKQIFDQGLENLLKIVDDEVEHCLPSNKKQIEQGEQAVTNQPSSSHSPTQEVQPLSATSKPPEFTQATQPSTMMVAPSPQAQPTNQPPRTSALRPKGGRRLPRRRKCRRGSRHCRRLRVAKRTGQAVTSSGALPTSQTSLPHTTRKKTGRVRRAVNRTGRVVASSGTLPTSGTSLPRTTRNKTGGVRTTTSTKRVTRRSCRHHRRRGARK